MPIREALARFAPFHPELARRWGPVLLEFSGSVIVACWDSVEIT
jgi:hypothetical protein